MRFIIPILLASGCFQVTHTPACEELSVTEVADDEATPAGTAQEIIDNVQFDEEIPAVWDNGETTTAIVHVERTGSAEWVEVAATTIKSRSVGFGEVYLMMAVQCDDTLRVPLDVDVTTPDGPLSVNASGYANRTRIDVPAHVYASGRFADSEFPATEHDPGDFTDKYSFVNLMYDELGLIEGSAGWGGNQETDDSSMSLAEYVLDFSAAD